MDYLNLVSSNLTKELYYIIPVFIAMLLGAVLGWQRIHWGKSAGPRTYSLVSAGSAMFTILSLNAFSPDVARVAAGIVTGIGFLGAGTILRKSDHIEGLTTAAGMWMAAAIGMAVGSGYYILATLTTIISLVLLMLHSKEWDKPVKKRK